MPSTPNFVVLLNGPPRVGKDTAAEALLTLKDDKGAPVFARQGFADELKDMTHRLYGVLGVPFDHFEPYKDMASYSFHGISPRRAYIAVSENLMKPLYGPQVFGELWLRRWARLNSGFPGAVVPDSGFAKEAEVLIDAVGVDNVLLVRLARDGTSYVNDSRSYVDLPAVQTVTLKNEGSIADFQRLARNLVTSFAADRGLAVDARSIDLRPGTPRRQAVAG